MFHWYENGDIYLMGTAGRQILIMILLHGVIMQMIYKFILFVILHHCTYIQLSHANS